MSVKNKNVVKNCQFATPNNNNTGVQEEEKNIECLSTGSTSNKNQTIIIR